MAYCLLPHKRQGQCGHAKGNVGIVCAVCTTPATLIHPKNFENSVDAMSFRGVRLANRAPEFSKGGKSACYREKTLLCLLRPWLCTRLLET